MSMRKHTWWSRKYLTKILADRIPLVISFIFNSYYLQIAYRSKYGDTNCSDAWLLTNAWCIVDRVCSSWRFHFKLESFSLMTSFASATSLLTTSPAVRISVISPTPWPAYMAMLSTSPVAVAFGTVPANRRISLCWSQELLVSCPFLVSDAKGTKCAIQAAISGRANYSTEIHHVQISQYICVYLPLENSWFKER